MALTLRIRPQALREMRDIGDRHTRTIASEIKEAAEAASPVGETSDLKSSHGVKRMRLGLWIVTVDKFYAAWVHWGRKEYGDKGQPWILRIAKVLGLTARGGR